MSAKAGTLRTTTTIALCCLTAVLEGYDVQAFGVAAPKLVAAMGLDPFEQGLAASLAMVGLVFGAFLGGRTADRFGRKPILLSAAAIFGLCSIWTGLSAHFTELLLARFATGIGFGGAFPVLIAIAAEVAPPTRRATVNNLIFCGFPAGGALVSLLVHQAGAALDWRMIFLTGGALPLILLPLLWLLLPETRPERGSQDATGLHDALFAGGRALATVLLAGASFLIVMLLYMILNWLPSLVIAKGLDPASGAAAAFAFNIAGVCGTALLGFVIDLIGAPRTFLIGYAALFAAVFLLGAATSAGATEGFSAVTGFFTVGISCALYALAPACYPASLRAEACGVIVGIGRLGTIAGPLLAGQLRQAGWSADHVIEAMLPVVLIGGSAALFLTWRLQPQLTSKAAA
ncbi:MAG: MFS transporter [Alphaproteobacteria bacterium]|nr:MFS transporter [Alphaproteobacteria bacterium]